MRYYENATIGNDVLVITAAQMQQGSWKSGERGRLRLVKMSKDLFKRIDTLRKSCDGFLGIEVIDSWQCNLQARRKGSSFVNAREDLVEQMTKLVKEYEAENSTQN